MYKLGLDLKNMSANVLKMDVHTTKINLLFHSLCFFIQKNQAKYFWFKLCYLAAARKWSCGSEFPPTDPPPIQSQAGLGCQS